MATTCGSCHVGGSLPEKGLDGLRHSMRQPDMTMATFNPYNNYVEEKYDSTSGLPAHWNNPFNPAAGVADGFGIGFAMWSMPGTFDNQFTAADGSNAVIPSMFVPTANGWIQAGNPMISMGMAVEGQMAMPNVREMDCFMCHLEGFNNIINSAAVQMGYLNASPSLSSGLMNMFSQTYMPGTFEAAGAPYPGFEAFGAPVKLSGSMLSRLKAEPPTDNCRQCHIPTTMANMSDMFDKFLSSAPMEYNTSAAMGSLINGMAMPGYDLNSPFVMPGSKSPEVKFDFYSMGWKYLDGSDASGPFGLFPMALDSSWGMFDASGNPNMAVAGGNKDGMTGPLFYAGMETGDQNALKKATIPFPRADFFKRGDIWDNAEQEVHYSIGCGGCHYNTNVTNADLNQCDPGRGRTRMGGVEAGQIQLATGLPGIDTHDSVKRCQDCHITGKNIEGIAINTFGAPDPTNKHNTKGLTAMITKAIKLDASGNEIEAPGNHLDVMDCTVCHVYKKSMAVRSLDSTSGNRYPALIGFDQSKGIMGMFTDPMYSDSMDDATAIGAVTNNLMGMGFRQTSIDMYLSLVLYGGAALEAQMGMTFPEPFHSMPGLMSQDPSATLGDAARAMLKADMQEWTPIWGWWANQGKRLPGADGKPNTGAINPDWRRRLVPINFIVAQMWDDSQDGGATDANGDMGESDGSTISWDPWIARDMKTGMNFAGGPFATIPVGFGSDAYQSAYDANFNFTGAFKYVGVYGGNIMLTTPEEISAYKQHREDIKDLPGMDGKTWAATQLVFFGGNPFQVTHNIVGTKIHALGKNGCNDCHSSSSNFFTGAYDMTGSGIDASVTYDYDDSGFTGGMDMADPIANNFMFRPVVDFEVTALKDDLRTGSESYAKNGAFYDVEFDICLAADRTTEVACEDAAAVYRQTHDLGRDEFMYPELDATALAAKVAAMTTERTLADYGIGIDPVAAIATIDGKASGDTGFASVVTGASVTLAADETVQPVGNFNYYWYINDGLGVNGTTGSATYFEGASIDHVFAKKGTWTVTLKVIDEEGRATQTFQKVTVAAATSTITVGVTADGGAGNTSTITFDSLPAGTDTLYILWGDGSKEKYEAGSDITTVALDHVFSNNSQFQVSAGVYVYKLSVYAFDGGSRLMSKGLEITIDGQ